MGLGQALETPGLQEKCWEGREKDLLEAPPQCPRRPPEGARALAFPARSWSLRRTEPGSRAARRRDLNNRAVA